MKVFLSLLALCALAALVLVGVGVAKLDFLFGVILPYVAVVVFIVGFIYRVLKWAKIPVPFNITTTCGQQKSHSWIKRNEIENPTTKLGVIARMALEVLFFRSLFRNTKAELLDDQRVAYSSDKLLWLAGLVFHWSFLVIVVRHLRFFVEPVPSCVGLLEGLDSFFQVGLPLIYITDLTLVVAVTYLFFRRVAIPQLRYIPCRPTTSHFSSSWPSRSPASACATSAGLTSRASRSSAPDCSAFPRPFPPS